MTLINTKLPKVIMRICVITFGIINSNAQNIIFVDNNFKQALLEYDNPIIDINADDEISFLEAELITELDIHNKNIFNLTGINHFVNLEILDCWENAIGTINLDLPLLSYLNCNNSGVANLNLSNLPSLETLHCNTNFLTVLDFSNNVALKTIYSVSNFYSYLDLSSNPNLETLFVGSNSLSNGINVSKNIKLTELVVAMSSISELDVSNNPNLIDFISNFSPNLTCIQIADEEMANNNEGIYENWTKDTWTVYSEDCSTVSLNDFENITFNIYPNPVKDFLVIENTENIKINSIKIYSILGKLILNKPIKNNQIDLSSLKRGNWFIKIETNNEFFTKMIIKL